MIEYENHHTNLDFEDKYGVKDVIVDRSTVYTGRTKLINPLKPEESCGRKLLATSIIGEHNTNAPITSDLKCFWSDIDAQEAFLNTKPTCYLILGKPGIGEYSLGEELARKLKCIHLCPLSILQDEIKQNSPTGTVIDFNLRTNTNGCFSEIILPMLKIKLKSDVVQHRGYVVSGFPLVTCSKKSEYLIQSLFSEEACLDVVAILLEVLTNLKKKKSKKAQPSGNTSESSIVDENVEEEEMKIEEEVKVEEEEEKQVELPNFILDTCSDILVKKKPRLETKQNVILQQLEEIFNLNPKPDIIIYIDCPDDDVIRKRNFKYINYKSGNPVVEPFTRAIIPDLRWPLHYNLNNENSTDLPVFDPKYYCRQPSNFRLKSTEQICNFFHLVYPYIERNLKDYDPKCIIKLDGRTTVDQMMHQIMNRLVLLHINPVIIPEPLYTDAESDMEEFWKNVEDSYKFNNGAMSFSRCASLWYNRCPVELKQRHTVVGKPRFAVMMFKHVYLMHSLPNLISFWKNPRPFLKLEYLEPTCRMIILGTKLSGKSMISECLSWLFDSPIINYESFLEKEIEKKRHAFSVNILSEIIGTIEDARFGKWQGMEIERVSQLNAWCKSALQLLQSYIPLLIKYNSYQEQERLAQENVPEELGVGEEEYVEKEIKKIELDQEFWNNYNFLRKKLQFLPTLDDINKCELLVKTEQISQYAPANIVTSIPQPAIPVLGDEDVTQYITDYILANDLAKEFEPTTEEIVKEIIQIISEIDYKVQIETKCEQNYGKYIIDGFPSDPEFWNYLIDSKMLPDYSIALLENRETDLELMQQYINIEKHEKYYKERFLLAEDPLIRAKLGIGQSNKLTEMDFKIIAADIVNMINYPDETPQVPESYFTEEFINFRENWDSIKQQLEDNSKCYVEVEIGEKTDVEVVQNVLLNLRKCYLFPGERTEDEADDEENEAPKDVLTYNDSQILGETNIYCPVTYYEYNILWEGKPEWSLKHNNLLYRLSSEEFLEKFEKDVTKYQKYNEPLKDFKRKKICIIGSVGSGTTTVAKHIAKELGLLYIDFEDFLVNHVMPKHFKKVGRIYENPFTDEPVGEEEEVVDFQIDEETSLDDILTNEKELRRCINDYYEQSVPITPILMQKVITKIFFDIPCINGFILDGYPRLTNDVEDMIATFCIPDLIIELEGEAEVCTARVVKNMMRDWKAHFIEAKMLAKNELNKKRQEWLKFVTQKVVMTLIIEEFLDKVFESVEPPPPLSPVESTIMDADPAGSLTVDPLLFSTYNELIEEFPEPIDTREWEKAEDVKERLESRIETMFESDYENIQTMKDLFIEQKLKCVTINSTKPLDKVLRDTLSKCAFLRNRNRSFFEQTFIVSSDMAEILLAQGFCLLSKFNRMCPVYIYENKTVISNPYYVYKQRDEIFPVVHRSFVYFIAGKNSVKKFRNHPLMYIISNSIESYLEHPISIAIIGPPKSGKSTLASKLVKDYGLISFTKGMVLRNVVDNMPWTELASYIFKKCQEGKVVENDLIIKAVQTAALDYRTQTIGYILDGFPDNPYEAMELEKIGLYPNIIFDITANAEIITKNSQNEIYYDILKYKPPYPIPFIRDRFKHWQENSYKIRNWIDEDYQNINILCGEETKWHCSSNATVKIKEVISMIHRYLANDEQNLVPVVCISDNDFRKRMSQFMNLCPVCFKNNILKDRRNAKNKTGVVQYKNTFYWICEEHLAVVSLNPDLYLTTNKIDIPDIPAIVNHINTKFVYENGVCIVTFTENLPIYKLVRGKPNIAATYKGSTYLFCSKDCLNRFLNKPHLYYDVKVFNVAKDFPKLNLKTMPNLGYLEQTLGNILTDACCAVNVARPKYPGLSIELSAILYIASYMKVNNPLLDKKAYPLYDEVFKLFERRCNYILKLALRLRSTDNPFAKYPKCLHRSQSNLLFIHSSHDSIVSTNNDSV